MRSGSPGSNRTSCKALSKLHPSRFGVTLGKNSVHNNFSILFSVLSRIGLMGNPSDGFFGKTISLSIANFWAEVTIVESSKLASTPSVAGYCY